MLENYVVLYCRKGSGYSLLVVRCPIREHDFDSTCGDSKKGYVAYALFHPFKLSTISFTNKCTMFANTPNIKGMSSAPLIHSSNWNIYSKMACLGDAISTEEDFGRWRSSGSYRI
jgi:hypothetical protein